MSGRRASVAAGARTVVLAFVLALGAAMAQESVENDHAHAAAGMPTLGEAMLTLTRSGFVPMTNGEHDAIHVDVVYAHPTLFVAGDNPVPDGVYEGETVLLFVTENIHAGEFSWDPVPFDLYIDGEGPIAPSATSIVVPDAHHRTTRMTFELAADAQAALDGASRLEATPRTGSGEAEFAWDLPLAFAEVRFHGLPPADEPLDLSDAPVLRVDATDAGYAPGAFEVPVGQPVIVVLRNVEDAEHHFHVMDLPIGGSMRWLRTAGEADLFTDAELRVAGQVADHICDSESGICPTGQSVHLHANPYGSDAIAFIPVETGTFEAFCPLHPDETAPFTVVEAGVQAGVGAGAD